MNIVTKIVLTCANVAGYLFPLRYPGLINQLFSPGNELRRVVLNLGHFDFEIVSDLVLSVVDGFGFRISPVLAPLHL